MRKLIVLTFMTLDGVMQAPGGPDEDASAHFAYGGWSFPYFDGFMGQVMGEQIGRPFDLLLGRKTYGLFASFWPHQDEKTNPAAAPLNQATKYVATRNPQLALKWKNSVLLQGNISDSVRKLKTEGGPDLQVHGSGDLIQSLWESDLVDELWLKIYPLTLGTGKRLFAAGTIPAAFTLSDSRTSPLGVIVANYKRGGEVKTGSFA